MGQVWKKGRGGEGEGEEKYKGSRMQDFKANTIPHSNLPRLFNHTPFCYRRPPFKNSDHEACAFKAKIQSTNFAIAQIQWTWLSTKGRVKKVVSVLRMKFSIFDFIPHLTYEIFVLLKNEKLFKQRNSCSLYSILPFLKLCGLCDQVKVFFLLWH